MFLNNSFGREFNSPHLHPVVEIRFVRGSGRKTNIAQFLRYQEDLTMIISLCDALISFAERIFTTGSTIHTLTKY